MDAPSHAEEEISRRGRAAWFIVAALVAIFIVYPLSCGPVAVIWVRAGMDIEVLGLVYVPLLIACDWSPRIERACNAYLEVWFRVTNTDTASPD